MFTVPNPDRLTLYKDEEVAKLLRKDFQARFGEHSGVLYPVNDIELDSVAIKVKDARTGLAWSGHEFLPFVLEHPGLGLEFNVRMQSLAPADGDVVRLSARSGSEDLCELRVAQKQPAQTLKANLLDAKPAALGSLGRHLRTHFGDETVSVTTDGKGGVKSFVVPVIVGFVAWLAWLFAVGIVAGTAETLDKGGTVFIVMIPFALGWGFVESVPILENLLTFGPLPLALWGAVALARAERKNARAICEALDAS